MTAPTREQLEAELAQLRLLYERAVQAEAHTIAQIIAVEAKLELLKALHG